MKFKLTLIASLFFSSCFLFAESLKERMTARRPTIEKLKAEGIVGESHQGYLAFVGSTIKEKATVDAQNADRKKGYEIIAQKRGVKVEQIAKVRAAWYANNADKGHWVQKSNGQWQQK